MSNPFDVEVLTYDLTVQLACKVCDGTPEDIVQKYFELYPIINKQVRTKAKIIEKDYTAIATSNREELNPKHSVDMCDLEETDQSSDPRLAEAIMIAADAGTASISMIQRRMRVGYARSGRLVDQMGLLGIIEPADGAKPRKVLMSVSEISQILKQIEYRDQAIDAFLSECDS